MNVKSREFAELVGVLSVVASLLFVGFQLMLEQRVSMGSQFSARTALSHESLVSDNENPAWIALQAKLWENEFKPGWWNEEITEYQKVRNLTMEEMVMMSYSIRLGFVRTNNNYYQHTQGLISDDAWGNMISQLDAVLDRPFYRAIGFSSPYLEVGLLELMQDLVNNSEVAK